MSGGVCIVMATSGFGIDLEALQPAREDICVM